MQFRIYEMKRDSDNIDMNINIQCVPFEERFFKRYKDIYNECFFEMRRSLGVKPYNYFSDYDQIKEKSKDIFLLIEDDDIIGSVACYCNEIDDLFVNKRWQGRGIGRQLLLWGIRYIRSKNNCPIVLHVAEWNQKAVRLYESVGFCITQTKVVSI